MPAEIDINKLKALAEETVIHKKLVMDNCRLMFEYFVDKGDIQMGVDILKRGATHDNSKFNADEFKSLASIFKDKRCFTDAEAQLSPVERKAIEIHWKKNRHHPEYFDNYSDMSDLDMIEMVCDWFARSIQHGTKFLPFIKTRQKNRFHFEESQFKKILEYCKIMEKLYKSNITIENA